MQEAQNTVVPWVKQGYYIDVKDKQGQWKVCLITNVNKTHIRVRYDGWSCKFDEFLQINSLSIKPFRSLTKGYTGPTESTPVRQHFSFSQDHHKEVYETQIQEFTNSIQKKTQFQVIQFLCGHHYFWLDYLLTLSYRNVNQVNLVYQYFFKHLNLVAKYFQSFLKCSSLQTWFDGKINQNGNQTSQGQRAFARSIFEILDSAYYIMEGNIQKIRVFCKNNQQFVNQIFNGYQSHFEFISQYVAQIELYKLFERVVQKLSQDNNSQTRLIFIAAINRFFYVLQKTNKDSKQKKRPFVEKLCQITLRQCNKFNETASKQQQSQIDRIYISLKLYLSKYNMKAEILTRFQLLNLKTWKNLILSQKLERKMKGINKLKTYYNNLTAPIGKKQALVIFCQKQIADEEIRKLQIINAIFYENQHHQIIKKGCELVTQMYKLRGITIDDLETVWKSCRNRLEAVRKVMYSFFQYMCKQLMIDELNTLVKWVTQQNLTEQMDRNFFYILFRQILLTAKQEKFNILKRLFQYSENRLIQNKQQMKSFADLLTMPKSIKFGFFKQYSKKFINMIPIQKQSQNSIFFLRLVNELFDQLSRLQNIQLQPNNYMTIYNYLITTLQAKTKKQNIQQYFYKKEKIAQLLKLLQNLIKKFFDLQIHQFIAIWDLFNQQQNRQLREQQLLPWIIKSKYVGTLKIQMLQINECLNDPSLRKQIFNQVLKNHTQIDFINMNDIEFKIFKKFQLQVNAENGVGVIQNRFQGLSGIQYFRVNQKAELVNGLRELWDILLNCRNFSVVRKAIRLYKQFHLNYHQQVGIQFRKRKLQELLVKVNRHLISDGIKKTNVRVLKNMLYLTYEIVTTIKETFRTIQPAQYHSHRPKKLIKIIKDQKQIKQIQVNVNHTIKSLKNHLCKQLNIPSYNLKLYKTSYVLKKVGDEGNDVASDQASAGGSSHTEIFSKNSPKNNFIRILHEQEIPNQFLYASITSLFLPQNQARIIVAQRPNLLYQLLSRFICQKMSEYLLKILADTQTYTKQSSQLAYHILIQVPSSLQPYEVLNNLINQLRIKNKDGENNSTKINLSGQSINFRMYFCKNINRLRDEQFCQFLSSENIKMYQAVFKEISKQIIQSQQIQLIIQVINLTKRALNKNILHQSILNIQSIFLCMINLIQFILGPQETQQFKKQQRSQLNYNQIKVFLECWNILELMHKEKDRILDSVVSSQYFQKIITYIFKNMPKNEFAEHFANRFEKYLKAVQKQKNQLEQKTQQILCYVIFDVLYYDIIKKKSIKNVAFFKVIKDLIAYLSNKTIEKLFTKTNDNISFWQNCVNIIKQQSDLENNQKENRTLNGHLLILQSLIRKNSSIVDLNICKLILYSCLCYKEGQTIGDDVKCISKNSINAALCVLFSICQSDQNLLKFVIAELRKYQQTQYWRTSQFWNVNAELQLKSDTGFVGLDNPGCICYLNSFTQTLFMNEQFRNRVIGFSIVDESKDCSLLIQLRKIFLNLQYSNQKYLNPVPFTLTIKNSQDRPMIKIYEQMDIQEYMSILFDKIQRLLPKDQDFVKEIFGGVYSNDIISQQCKHSSQREEGFLSMQLDVKSNLEESLKTLVKSQILEGQNAYYCQSCAKKVKAIKRMSIKKLPNYLIICLKRFQYNFQIDQKTKLNAYCQFNRELYLQQYSQQYLNSISQQQARVQQADTETQSLPPQYFDYRLKGVIIHSGSSESGHYYALIDTENNKWLEFNDNMVYDFDISKLPEEAFGSDDPTNPKFKNAYMLVYERKKKMPQKNQGQKMQVQQSQKFVSKQTQNIYNSIKNHNKMIRTFQMMFSNQYRVFVQQIMQSTLTKNQSFIRQYKKYASWNGSEEFMDNQDECMGEKNLYLRETIIQMMKYYFEYCMFIRSRQISIHIFIENLTSLTYFASMEYCSPIADYIIKQLSQKALIQQLFIEVSFRDKVTVISRFLWEIVVKRMINKASNKGRDLVGLVLRLVGALLEVIIRDGNCCNQILYVIRKIAQLRDFMAYLQRIDIMTILFEIIFGISQSQSSKIQRIKAVRKQIQNIIKTFNESPEEEPHSSSQQSNSQMQQQQQISFDWQQSFMSSYQITPVKKSGRCVLKLESPQELWNYLYFVYKHECYEYQKFCQQNPQNLAQFHREASRQKLLYIRRANLQEAFFKIKDDRIAHVVQQCQGLKTMNSLSLFFCQLQHNKQNITQKILLLVKKGIKKLQATKFRCYLVLLYQMAMHHDQYLINRHQSIIGVIMYALLENIKYTSEIDILHQWIMKMAIVSANFADSISRNTSQKGQLVSQVLLRIQTSKKPSAEQMKKQRNPNCQRLNYQLHGLLVSTDYEDYQKLYETKKTFFNCLFHQSPLPNQFMNSSKVINYKQPSYKQLTHQIRPGDFLYIWYKKWVKVIVKFYRFGLVKMHRIIKDIQKPTKTSDARTIKIQLDNFIVQIGQNEKIAEQQICMWEYDQKLRCFQFIQRPKLKNKDKQKKKEKEKEKNKDTQYIFEQEKDNLIRQDSYLAYSQSQSLQQNQNNNSLNTQGGNLSETTMGLYVKPGKKDQQIAMQPSSMPKLGKVDEMVNQANSSPDVSYRSGSQIN